MLTALKPPEGVDDATIRSGLLNRFGIEIGGGLGAFKGQVWRIGIMGHAARQSNVLTFLAAFDQQLAENGYEFSSECSIAAANSAFAHNE